MKDTLRKGAKASEADTTPSETTESTSNPWVNEPAASPPPKERESVALTADSDSGKSAQTAANGDNDSLRAPSQPPARRRKTVTKLPGTFELKDDMLKKVATAEPSTTKADEAKEELQQKQSMSSVIGEKIESLRTKKKKKTISNVSNDGMPLSPTISSERDQSTMRSPTSPDRNDVTSPAPSVRIPLQQRPVTPERKPSKNDVASPPPASRTSMPPSQPAPKLAQANITSPPPASTPRPSDPTPQPPAQIRNDIASPVPPAVSRAPPQQSSSSTPSNPFTTPQKRTKPKSTTTSSSTTVVPLRIFPPSTSNAFFQKVIVLTSGPSPIGTTIVRHFHSLGARVIFGHDPSPPPPSTIPTSGPGSPGSPGSLTPAMVASNLIRSLGPPHSVHSQPCRTNDYRSMLSLFKLGMTMYGKVDHAIFLADDGSSKTVGAGEKGWLSRFASIEDVERIEPPSQELGSVLTAAMKFAHIALPYLRHVKQKNPSASKHRRAVSSADISSEQTPTKQQGVGTPDRSLTFVSSVAGFTTIPGLPVHSVTQHGVLGLTRSLKTMVDADNDLPMGPHGLGKVRVRVNTVCPGMMIPRTHGSVGGRMSVKMPDVEPEDVGRVVVGVVASGGAGDGEEEGGGAKSPYESALQDEEGGWSGAGRDSNRKRAMSGRVLYIVEPGLCWDVEEGLGASESAWLGQMGAERLRSSKEGLEEMGGGSQWLLDEL